MKPNQTSDLDDTTHLAAEPDLLPNAQPDQLEAPPEEMPEVPEATPNDETSTRSVMESAAAVANRGPQSGSRQSTTVKGSKWRAMVGSTITLVILIALLPWFVSFYRMYWQTIVPRLEQASEQDIALFPILRDPEGFRAISRAYLSGFLQDRAHKAGKTAVIEDIRPQDAITLKPYGRTAWRLIYRDGNDGDLVVTTVELQHNLGSAGQQDPFGFTITPTTQHQRQTIKP